MRKEVINTQKLNFVTLNAYVPPSGTPYSKEYQKLLVAENFDRRAWKLTRYFQYHVWNYGEIPSNDKLKEYLQIKTDTTLNKYIIALRKNPDWMKIIFIKPKWKTRFKKMGLQVNGGGK